VGTTVAVEDGVVELSVEVVVVPVDVEVFVFVEVVTVAEVSGSAGSVVFVGAGVFVGRIGSVSVFVGESVSVWEGAVTSSPGERLIDGSSVGKVTSPSHAVRPSASRDTTPHTATRDRSTERISIATYRTRSGLTSS
jgi:hypothetical protein